MLAAGPSVVLAAGTDLQRETALLRGVLLRGVGVSAVPDISKGRAGAHGMALHRLRPAALRLAHWMRSC